MVAEPGRDAVPPPDLAGDAPVADILHPVVVGVFPLFRDDPGLAVLHRCQGPFRQRGDLDIPLQRQVRLDHGLAAIAAAHRHGVVLDLLQQARPLPGRQRSACGRRSGPALRTGAGGIDDAGFVEDVDPVQAVAQADLEVVEVVGRGDLDHAGAELQVHIIVGDDRDLAVDQRQEHLFADQVPGSARPRDAPPRRYRPAWSRDGWWRPPRYLPGSPATG